MDLGLGHPQYPGESTFAEMAIGNSVIYKPDQSRLECSKRDGIMAEA